MSGRVEPEPSVTSLFVSKIRALTFRVRKRFGGFYLLVRLAHSRRNRLHRRLRSSRRLPCHRPPSHHQPGPPTDSHHRSDLRCRHPSRELTLRFLRSALRSRASQIQKVRGCCMRSSLRRRASQIQKVRVPTQVNKKLSQTGKADLACTLPMRACSCSRLWGTVVTISLFHCRHRRPPFVRHRV